MNSLFVPMNDMAALRKVGGKSNQLYNATLSKLRIACKRNLPKLVQQRGSLGQPPNKPSVAAELVSIDKNMLIGMLLCEAANVVYNPRWKEEDDIAEAEAGEELIRTTPALKIATPAYYWIFKNYSAFETDLAAIIKDCHSASPGILEEFEGLLSDYLEQEQQGDAARHSQLLADEPLSNAAPGNPSSYVNIIHIM